ncbi:MAG: phosphatase PAP2-related protein [Bacteroidota bacterium]
MKFKLYENFGQRTKYPSRVYPIHQVWKAAWTHAAFRVQVLVTIPALLVVLTLFSHFLEWVEVRSGVVLSDPIVVMVDAHDFTWSIFIFIYAGVVIGLVTLSAHPVQLIVTVQSYIVMVSIRVVAMYVTPLDPPTGIIPLADPFVQFFGTGAVPTKDLFFSGHTATLFLLSLTANGRWLKALFAFCAVAVAILIVWQHVHYVVDVLVAPFVAYTSYRLVVLFQDRVNPSWRLS